jgi:anaerobic selenocysteine-containing dehydrogenase
MFAVMSTPTPCRLCPRTCGLLAESGPSGLIGLLSDPGDPVSRGLEPCGVAQASVHALRHADRIRRPWRRVDGRLVPATWAEAITEIGGGLNRILASGGGDAWGLYLGAPLAQRTADFVRALSVGIAGGSRWLFSEALDEVGPVLLASEWVLGHPALLLSDIGRAHYVVLLGGESEEAGAGMASPGAGLREDLRHSRRTKGAKVVVVDPRRTSLAAEMDQHLAILPGSEAFFLLGMLSAVVKGGWGDQQFIRDYTEDYAELSAALDPWTVERCAARCGIPAATLSGVALKFGRSPMALVHPGFGTFTNAHGTLAAWAWLALHAVTANLLRPGGLYDHPALVDLHLPLAQALHARAPRLPGSERALLALQAPPTELAGALSRGGLRGLVCLEGDPAGQLSGVEEGLAQLELLVWVGRAPDATAARAHWLLPATHPWEAGDLELVGNSLLPLDLVRMATAVSHPVEEARTVDQILRDLFAAARAPIGRSPHGLKLGLLARGMASADLQAWQRRILEWSTDLELSWLEQPPHRVEKGPSDRSLWRVSHPSGRVRLVPAELSALLRRASTPEGEGLRLRGGRRSTPLPPDAHHGQLAAEGFVNPAHLQGSSENWELASDHGNCVVRMLPDANLREGVVEVGRLAVPESRRLRPHDAGDPAGVPAWDGVVVRRVSANRP